MVKLKLLTLFALMYLLVVQTHQTDAKAKRELPSPSTPPEKFTSRQELREFLKKLHEYAKVVLQLRSGRSFSSSLLLKPK